MLGAKAHLGAKREERRFTGSKASERTGEISLSRDEKTCLRFEREESASFHAGLCSSGIQAKFPSSVTAELPAERLMCFFRWIDGTEGLLSGLMLALTLFVGTWICRFGGRF
jgi:hypothetical protein